MTCSDCLGTGTDGFGACDTCDGTGEQPSHGTPVIRSAFVAVPVWALRAMQDRLNPKALTNAVTVYVFLASYANRGRECHPSNQTIVDQTGLSLSGVQRAKSALREVGAVVQTDAQNRDTSSVYFLPLDPPAVAASAAQ